MFKNLFTRPTQNHTMKVKLTHHQKGLIQDAIKLHKMRAVYKKFGYTMPE